MVVYALSTIPHFCGQHVNAHFLFRCILCLRLYDKLRIEVIIEYIYIRKAGFEPTAPTPKVEMLPDYTIFCD